MLKQNHNEQLISASSRPPKVLLFIAPVTPFECLKETHQRCITNDGTTTLFETCFEEIHPHFCRQLKTINIISRNNHSFVCLLVYALFIYLTFHSGQARRNSYSRQSLSCANCFITQQVKGTKLVKIN